MNLIQVHLITFFLSKRITAFITSVMNNYLSLRRLPDANTNAELKPLMKEHKLDPENLKNYRLVSKLLFLSKILYNNNNNWKGLPNTSQTKNCGEDFQFTYRQHHSTETGLICVSYYSLINILDNGPTFLLSLLNLSHDIDTIDPPKLCRKGQQIWLVTLMLFTTGFVNNFQTGLRK